MNKDKPKKKKKLSMVQLDSVSAAALTAFEVATLDDGNYILVFLGELRERHMIDEQQYFSVRNALGV